MYRGPAHNEKVESGVVVGLFLRAMGICGSEYLEDEFNHMMQVFSGLHYHD